jgi:hypothetical protein
MAGFNMDDYVDVAERVQQFYAKYPDGRLLTAVVTFKQWPSDGIFAQAEAYRTPDDPKPGVGTAWEPVPGKTSFTKDSEVQNAETAAWGRAIAAVGIATKKIASKEEVQARQPARSSPAASAAIRPAAATRASVPTTPATSAAGDEHQRAHETKSTLHVKEPDQEFITDDQRKKLTDIAGPDGYRMSADQLRDAIEECTGQRNARKIKRYQFDSVLKAVNLAGRGMIA